LIGSQISHYRILRKLGEGGMGVVYEAYDLRLGRRVALKFPGAGSMAAEDVRERLLSEARAAAALNHPNICTVYEVDEADGQLFIAMEYCDGASLRELIRKGPLDPGVALAIVIQVAEGLTEAHNLQIVHRDIKSSNIMVDSRNHARLLDFGLASLGGPADRTETINHAGTPAYMSPERFEMGQSDARADIWGLGVVFYEALTGRLPFAGDPGHVAYSILNTDPEPPSALRPAVAPVLDEIVDKSLSKDPVERYQTAADMLADLVRARRLAEKENRPGPSAEATGTLPSGSSTARLVSKWSLHTVAVLPFVNMNQGAGDEFLSDGLTEEIANALTQVRGLRVASRASTFQFKSAALDVRDVGRRLRVGALVLGSVRRQGERVRVTAQLVTASDGYQIWSQRFDCEMKAVFDVEDQVTGAIVTHLRKWLDADLELSHLHGATPGYGAHEFYLRGRHAFNLQTPLGLEDALRFFSQALQLEPAYTLARVGMADCYAAQGWYGIAPALAVMPKAKAELQTALAADAALPAAACLRAAITAGFDWDWEAARAQFQEAFALAPPDSGLLFHYALDYLTPRGRLHEALEELKLALALDPAAPLLNTALGGCLYRLRLYPAALAQLQSTLEFAPGFYHAYWSMARVYQAQGRFAEAMDSFLKALAASGADNPAVLADAGHCHAVMGDAARAREILPRLNGVPLAEATVYLGLKETGAVLDHLRQAVAGRARGLIWLGVDPRFDELRVHPGFRSVMAPVGPSKESAVARTGESHSNASGRVTPQGCWSPQIQTEEKKPEAATGDGDGGRSEA